MKKIFYFLTIFTLLNCNAYSQTCFVSAGVDTMMCLTNNVIYMSYSHSEGGTGVSWNSFGTGTFDNTSLLHPTYVPSAADKASGSVLLEISSVGCGPLRDTVLITFVNGPVVDAGPDQTVCQNNSATLSGSYVNSPLAVWSTSGSGVFLPNPNITNPVYMPSMADQINGTVSLTLTAYGSGNCPAVSDVVVLTIVPAPVASAGPDLVVCQNSQVSLNGMVSGASGGTWSTTGTGIFSSTTNLSATYSPSMSDVASGTIFIQLTSSGNGVCPPSADTLRVNFVPSPVVSAGPDKNICLNASTVNIFGTVAYAGGSVWTSSGTGAFSPNAATDTVTYIPSVADKTAGTVILTITSTANGTCVPVSDQMTINFVSGPTINAGTDATVCPNTPVSLFASFTNSTGVVWSTQGTGVFSNATSATPVYMPSAADVQNGAVQLTVTSTGNGLCPAVSDNVSITIFPTVSVDAGLNKTLDNSAIALQGSTSSAVGVQWSTSGTGTFSNATSLNSSYIASAADLAVGHVTLTLTTTNVCPTSDFLVLTSNPQVCNLTISETISGNEVSFTATNGDGVSTGSYSWDFGDANSSIGKVQSHIFANAGTYNVSVYYLTPDSSCSASATKTITIASAPVVTYTVTGKVMAGANNLDHGVIALFKLDNTTYDMLTSKIISPSDNGNYTFSNLENGTYLVHCIVDHASSYFFTHVPTYLGNVTTWDNASVLQVTNTNLSNQSISLVAYTPAATNWNTGNDSITGTVTFDASVALRTTASSINPVANVYVKLLDNANQFLTYTYTDEFGNYGFGNLVAGTYKVVLEYPGGEAASSALAVNVDGNANTITEADNEILKETITLGLNSSKEAASIALYPNPVADTELHIQLPSSLNGEATINIYNSLGKPVMTDNASASNTNSLSVKVQSLSPGFYILEVSEGENIFRSTFTKH